MKCNILGKRLVKKCFKIMWNKKKNKWRYKSNMAQKSRNVINDKIIHEKKSMNENSGKTDIGKRGLLKE